MARTARRLTAVRGRAVRVTRTDSCGRPVYGEYNQAVSEGIVTTTFTPNTSDTEEINVTGFHGQRCVFEPSTPELAGYSLEIVFCNVDFELFEIITKQPLVFDALGTVVGIEMDTKIDLDGEGFGIETWTGTVGSDVCDNPSATGEWGYLLLPYLKGGIVSDITIENNAINFTITGASTREGNRWGNGPYAVDLNELGNPDVLFQPLSSTAALRLMVVSVPPPVSNSGARPLLNPSLPALASLAAVEGDSDMEADFTTTPVATGPVWYDFGDGGWDYVVAPGTASHLYEDPGTYVVKASQNGINWTTVSVTVPFP